MKVTFRSSHPDAVLEILEEQGLLKTAFGAKKSGYSLIVVSFQTDELYREFTLWLAAALGCGLISSPDVERE